MKRLLMGFLSLIVNAYFFLAWGYVFSSFKTHEDRANAFAEYIPEGVSVRVLSGVLILLSVVSIGMVAGDRLKAWIRVLFVLVQGGLLYC